MSKGPDEVLINLSTYKEIYQIPFIKMLAERNISQIASNKLAEIHENKVLINGNKEAIDLLKKNNVATKEIIDKKNDIINEYNTKIKSIEDSLYGDKKLLFEPSSIITALKEYLARPLSIDDDGDISPERAVQKKENQLQSIKDLFSSNKTNLEFENEKEEFVVGMIKRLPEKYKKQVMDLKIDEKAIRKAHINNLSDDEISEYFSHLKNECFPTTEVISNKRVKKDGKRLEKFSKSEELKNSDGKGYTSYQGKAEDLVFTRKITRDDVLKYANALRETRQLLSARSWYKKIFNTSYNNAVDELNKKRDYLANICNISPKTLDKFMNSKDRDKDRLFETFYNQNIIDIRNRTMEDRAKEVRRANSKDFKELAKEEEISKKADKVIENFDSRFHESDIIKEYGFDEPTDDFELKNALNNEFEIIDDDIKESLKEEKDAISNLLDDKEIEFKEDEIINGF